jgi:DNA-binding GntR family transcriptional regulator
VYTDSYAEGTLSSDRAHTELKRRLLAGEYPLAVRLGEERLAAQLGVSRTPVREALFRLHTEGLVRRAPDGGFEPVVPDVVAIRHLYVVREGLELLGLQLPARNGTTHDLSRLEELQDDWLVLAEDPEPQANPDFVLLDESFHLGLAEAAGNPVLADHLRQVNERIRIVRMQDFLSTERIVRTIREHLEIVAAVLDGDMAEAERRFVDHLDRSKTVVSEHVDRAIARMINGGQR